MAADEPMEIAVCTATTKKDSIEETKQNNASLSNNIKPPADIKQSYASNMANENADLEDVIIKIIPTDEGIVNLIMVDERDRVSDLSEEELNLTTEEVRKLIQQKVIEYVKSKDVNPILVEDCKYKELLRRVHKNEIEQHVQLSRMLDNLGKDRDKYLRKNGVMVKSSTSTIGVSVDLPILANSLTALNNASVTKVVKSSESSQKTASGAVAAIKTEKTAKIPLKPSGANIECIDLTDDNDPPKKAPAELAISLVKHPAPLPPRPYCPPSDDLPSIPPKPRVKISAEERGIVVQWDMPPTSTTGGPYAPVSSFDVFGYQEQRDIVINTLLWKKIGGVRAMNLPMACTLTQFVEGHKYHFSIRGVDVYGRFGFYSDPISITYKVDKSNRK